MLFNSKIYIFIFLPIILFGYFFISAKTKNNKLNIFWLVLAGFIFYASWNKNFIFLVFLSILSNYIFGICILQLKKNAASIIFSKIALVLGLTFNILLLSYFKYTNFFIDNLNTFVSNKFQQYDIILPLGISFFTFTQIAYLVDKYKEKVKGDNFLSYILFVNFFPHLLAGPIIHHKDMMSQFANCANKRINWENCYQGLFLFSIGLFKKIIIADYFGEEVNTLYLQGSMNFWYSWVASLGYSIQLYFDFSGYSDMALGSALFFNIKLPINFDSPYKAQNIQDFWQRWHVTLGQFLKEYIYIPLGGNKNGSIKTSLNLLITFLIGGIWHGAGWTFVIWGALHGIATMAHRVWQKLGINLHDYICIFITFLFVNTAWVFFRSNSLNQAVSIVASMYSSINYSKPDQGALLYLALASLMIFLCLFMPNSNELSKRICKSKYSPIFITTAAVLAILRVLAVPSTFFLYFQF